MPYQRITSFTAGLNVLSDPRRLKPNSDKETDAESPEMINVEITKTGSLITSTGFAKVCTISGTGGIKNLFLYDKDASTDPQLIIAHDDDYYYIETGDTSATTIGDYGDAGTKFGGTVYMGTSSTRRAILGTDVSANTIQQWDGSSLAAVSGSPPDSYIFTSFMGRLFAADGITLYYTNVEDETDWAGGGTIKFNDVITGLIVEGQRMIVFTRSYHQGVTFEYDASFNLSVPLKEPYERRYGAYASRAITRVGANARYWADDNRVYNLGAENMVDEQGTPRPMAISENIDPALNSVNLTYRENAVGIELENDQQWWLAVPNGNSQYNSLVYVLNENFDSWSTRFGFYPSSLAILRDSDYKPELYFGSALSPDVYKFNDEYTYDGAGYIRKWRSKKFTGGDESIFKEWKWVDVSGSMYASSSFTVRITVDQGYKEYTIDNTFLVQDAFGEYIGDNNIGDVLIGGSEPSESAFKRFKAHIPIHPDIREGFELEILIYNDAPGQPWKIDELGIDFEYHPRKKRKASFIVNSVSA